MKKVLLSIISLSFIIFSFAQVPSYVPTAGLVGWWPFTGNANDLSGNGNNGTLVGDVTLSNDRFSVANSAYSFDGSADYIDCGNATSVNITGSLTISAWVFATDLSGTRGIVSKSALPPTDDSYQMVAGAYIPTDLNFLNSNFGYLVPTANWVHLVSVFDSSSQTISLYTNGVLDTSQSVLFNTIGLSTDNLCLGAHRPSFTPNWSWYGILDDIGIWNRALVACEVQQLYNSSFPSSVQTPTVCIGSSVTVGLNTYDSTGVYIDTLVSSGGCDSIVTTNLSVINCSGIESSEVSTLNVFPNPTTGIIQIVSDVDLSNSPLFIIDMLGQVMMSKTINLQQGEIYTLDISSFVTGTYIIKVDNQHLRLIKQ